MVEYYTNFSFTFLATEGQQNWLRRYLDHHRKDLLADGPNTDIYVDAGVDYMGDTVRISCLQSSTNEHGLRQMLQSYLIETEPNGCFAYSVAYSASARRSGACGGAAYVITSKMIASYDLAEWLHDETRKVLRPKKNQLRKLND